MHGDHAGARGRPRHQDFARTLMLGRLVHKSISLHPRAQKRVPERLLPPVDCIECFDADRNSGGQENKDGEGQERARE